MLTSFASKTSTALAEHYSAEDSLRTGRFNVRTYTQLLNRLGKTTTQDRKSGRILGCHQHSFSLTKIGADNVGYAVRLSVVFRHVHSVEETAMP
jgi:hypothetical protein